MKHLILVLIGLVPLAIGYLLNHLVMTIWFYELPSGLLPLGSLAVLALWFIIGRAFARFYNSKWQPILLLNSAAIVALILVLAQTFTGGGFWLNWLGIASMFFYLPLITLAGIMLNVLSFLLPVISLAMLNLVGLGLLILASYLGVRMGKAN